MMTDWSLPRAFGGVDLPKRLGLAVMRAGGGAPYAAMNAKLLSLVGVSLSFQQLLPVPVMYHRSSLHDHMRLPP